MPVVSHTPKVMSATRNYTYNPADFDDEAKVMDCLSDQGYVVEESEVSADVCQDIDCYLNGISTSIKAQHKGLSYGHIYFELCTEIRNGQQLSDLQKDFLGGILPPNLLRYIPSGFQGWYFSGKASWYAILQGTRLRIYDKRTIAKMIDAGEFVHIRGLSKAVKAGQNGKETICVYLDASKVPFLAEYQLPEVAQR